MLISLLLIISSTGRCCNENSTGLSRDLAYDTRLLQRYQKALDTAVKIATTHNVTPIKGTSVVFVQMDKSMMVPCTAARGLGQPRKVSGGNYSVVPL